LIALARGAYPSPAAKMNHSNHPSCGTTELIYPLLLALEGETIVTSRCT
jgi:hypothetical protein